LEGRKCIYNVSFISCFRDILSEVANAISICKNIYEAVVYGVKVPGTEGRVGMAAISVTKKLDEFDFDELFKV
jgi:hypothetical protein